MQRLRKHALLVFLMLGSGCTEKLTGPKDVTGSFVISCPEGYRPAQHPVTGLVRCVPELVVITGTEGAS